MGKKPKESFLPIAIAGGAMLVCCLAPVLLVAGGSGLVAWLGGFDPLFAAGVAVAIGAGIVLFRRRRNTVLTENERAPRRALKGDQ
jgi:hypothetical protein